MYKSIKFFLAQLVFYAFCSRHVQDAVALDNIFIGPPSVNRTNTTNLSMNSSMAYDPRSTQAPLLVNFSGVFRPADIQSPSNVSLVTSPTIPGFSANFSLITNSVHTHSFFLKKVYKSLTNFCRLFVHFSNFCILFRKKSIQKLDNFLCTLPK